MSGKSASIRLKWLYSCSEIAMGGELQVMVKVIVAEEKQLLNCFLLGVDKGIEERRGYKY